MQNDPQQRPRIYRETTPPSYDPVAGNRLSVGFPGHRGGEQHHLEPVLHEAGRHALAHHFRAPSLGVLPVTPVGDDHDPAPGLHSEPHRSSRGSAPMVRLTSRRSRKERMPSLTGRNDDPGL